MNIFNVGAQDEKGTKSGFTLIELLVVIAIVGLIASVAMAALSEARKNARNTKRLADVRQYFNALEFYLDENGSYPSTSNALRCLGIYPTVDGRCWINNGTPRDDNLNNDLLNYMPSLPPGPQSYNVLGYVYCGGSCTNQNYAMIIRWMMEGIDQSCGIGVKLSNFPSNPPLMTHCQIAR
jgi:prepilin-type N-terminal cleavage/methylation domain-containing protein